MNIVIVFAAYLVLLLGTLGTLVFLKVRSRQDRAPFPEKTRLLRGPGESLRRKIEALDEQLQNAILLSFGLPAVMVAVPLFVARKLNGGLVILFVGLALLLMVVTMIYCGRRIVALLDRRNNTSLGYFGERAVAEALEPLKVTGHRVFHDIPGESPSGSAFNLDHVVVGPSGIFAIETKTRRKGRARTGFMAHEIIYDGRALAYPWGEDQHGLDQALRQSEWLAGFLSQQLGKNLPVMPLLVFPGWFIIRKGRGPVNVLNPRELPAAIQPRAGASPVLEPSTIDLVARQLEARCRDVEL